MLGFSRWGTVRLRVPLDLPAQRDSVGSVVSADGLPMKLAVCRRVNAHWGSDSRAGRKHAFIQHSVNSSEHSLQAWPCGRTECEMLIAAHPSKTVRYSPAFRVLIIKYSLFLSSAGFAWGKPQLRSVLPPAEDFICIFRAGGGTCGGGLEWQRQRQGWALQGVVRVLEVATIPGSLSSSYCVRQYVLDNCIHNTLPWFFRVPMNHRISNPQSVETCVVSVHKFAPENLTWVIF